MFATLVIIMTFNGSGFQPAVTQAIAMPVEQCEPARSRAPHVKNWTTVAFCTPGGDPALNPKRQ